MIIPFGFFKAGESGPPPPTYILDTYPSELAWSFRKLITGATNSCRIRRSSDDAETNVVLTESGSMTTASTVTAGGTLGDWVTTDDGFIVTLFDQMGNGYDYTTAVKAEQPQIITGGAIETENSLATMLMGNPSLLTGTAFVESNFSIFSAITCPTTYTVISYMLGNSGVGVAVGGTNATFSSPFVIYASKQMRGATVRPSGHKLFEWFNDAVFFDDSEDTPYDVDDPLTQLQFSSFGARPDVTTLNMNTSKIQEVIGYATNENGGNRAAIRGDMATFYGTT